MKYEFVSKSEYRPVRNELESIIHKVQKIMRKICNLSFQYQLIGSGNRHLITRIKGGNKGYDFDYNFILPTLNDGNKNKKTKDRYAKKNLSFVLKIIDLKISKKLHYH